MELLVKQVISPHRGYQCYVELKTLSLRRFYLFKSDPSDIYPLSLSNQKELLFLYLHER